MFLSASWDLNVNHYSHCFRCELQRSKIAQLNTMARMKTNSNGHAGDRLSKKEMKARRKAKEKAKSASKYMFFMCNKFQPALEFLLPIDVNLFLSFPIIIFWFYRDNVFPVVIKINLNIYQTISIRLTLIFDLVYILVTHSFGKFY